MFKSWIALTVLAGVMCFWGLGSKSLWLDEVSSVIFSRNFGEMVRVVKTEEANMWLYYLLLHVWLKVGHSEWWIRSLSAVFAVGSVPMFFILAKRLVGEKIAKLATPLLLVNTLFMLYAQQARAYPLMLFWVLVGAHLYLDLLENPNWKKATLFAAVTTLGIYSHLYVGLITFAQYAALVFAKDRRKSWKMFALAGFLIGAGVLPLVLMPSFKSHATGWIGRPELVSVGAVFVTLAGDEAWLVPAYGLVMGLALWRKKGEIWGHTKERFKIGLLLIWIGVPIGLAVGYSMFFRPIFTSVYFLGVLPAWVMLAGWSINNLKTAWKRWVYVGILTVAGLRLLAWYTGGDWHWVIRNRFEDWRGATRYIYDQRGYDDAVIFFTYYVRPSFELYFDKYPAPKPQVLEISSRQYLLGGGVKLPEFNHPLLERLPEKYNRVWLVLSHNDREWLGRKTQWQELEEILKKDWMVAETTQFEQIEIKLLERLRQG